MEAKVIKNRWGSEVRLLKTWVPNETGDLAIRFATHFGIIAATDNGEDTAGRHQIKLAEVADVVKRSCDLAEQLVEEMKKRGWIVNCPDLPENEPEEEPQKKEPPEDTSGIGAPQGGS
jgi:hypothetical protein